MTTNGSKAVAEYLIKAAETTEGAKEFLTQPLPPFIVEYLKYEMFFWFMLFAIFSLLSIGGFALAFHLAKKARIRNKDFCDKNEGALPFFVGVLAMILAIFAPFPFTNGMEIVTSPKTFLLKQADIPMKESSPR